ncbi:TetR/AcrR family transcriptional regulator [Oribacterium sp. WCC10]|uniref:TetR/AcrR family transcriptional regulator n=1 Tax=Oribacterium sp. WCC10 TaxID=1855343 RepID=UPI001FA8CDCE
MQNRQWLCEQTSVVCKYPSAVSYGGPEICKEAEIERPTFYYHFKDKYDLMAWMIFQSMTLCPVMEADYRSCNVCLICYIS